MIPQRCLDCSKKVEWVVLGINFGLFFFKGWFALMCYSKSLLVDAFESLANVLITIVVIISLKIASRGTDEKFPYGYGKVEFLAAAVVNMLLMLVAIIYIIMSLAEMAMVGPERPPGLMAGVVAAISILVNYIAFGYGRCAGEKVGSSAMLANSQINLSDIGTSVAVIVAVVGSNMGFPKLDHIIAILICVIIIKMTLDGIKKTVNGLMDITPHSEEQNVRSLIEKVVDAGQIGDIRTRFVGRSFLVNMDIFLPHDIVLSRGLEIVGKIKDILQSQRKDISDVTVQLLSLPVADEPVRKTDYLPKEINE